MLVAAGMGLSGRRGMQLCGGSPSGFHLIPCSPPELLPWPRCSPLPWCSSVQAVVCLHPLCSKWYPAKVANAAGTMPMCALLRPVLLFKRCRDGGACESPAAWEHTDGKCPACIRIPSQCPSCLPGGGVALLFPNWTAMQSSWSEGNLLQCSISGQGKP